MKKGDLLLILILLLGAAGLYFYFFSDAEAGAYARITVDGTPQGDFSLEENTVFNIETDGGYNEIAVEDGFVFVKAADCRDQICVEHKRIHIMGETIVCLPHKLVVEIIGGQEADFDVVVG